MVDLKKEIKLSDLVPRRKPKPRGGERRLARPSPSARRRSASSSASRSAPRSSPPRASSTTARPSSSSVARRPLERGVVVGGEVRDVPALAQALDTLLRGAQAAAPRRSARARDEPDRRARLRRRRDRRRAPARQRDPLPRPRGGRRSRSTRPCSTTTSSARPLDEAGNVSRRILLAAAYRESIDRYVEACRAANDRAGYGIDLEAFALLRAVAPAGQAAADKPVRPRRRLARARPLDPRHLRRRGLRVHARARVGRREARVGDRPRPRRHARRGARAAARRLARARRRSEPGSAAGRRCARRSGGELQKLARELVASLQFYQSQPGSLAISRDPRLGRHEPDAGPAGGARAPDARGRPPRGSARPRASAPADVQVA